MNKKSLLCLLLCVCLMSAIVFTGCGEKSDDAAVSTADSVSKTPGGIDYMVLVNKTHKITDGWDANLETVRFTNSLGEEYELEKKTYDAYLKLKSALEAEDVFVDIDSALRSDEDQVRIMDEYTVKYGADYAAKTIAQPGFSEHQSGLALDLILIVDGKCITNEAELFEYPEIWEKIHEKIDDYGFILRYLEDAEYITGYSYEPWHIRYINDPAIAQEITAKGITFEEYLGVAKSSNVTIDYGHSEIYTDEELHDAIVQIKCRFAYWDGCELKSIRYAGDGAVTEQNLRELNDDDPNIDYMTIAKFLMDFHTPKDVGTLSFRADAEYTDYQWWLARTDDNTWEIIVNGYGI